MPIIKRQGATLSPRQIRALECLVSQGPDESYQSVADRAGIHRATLYRFMADPVFYKLFTQRIRDEFRLTRLQVSRALIKNAKNGDVQSQRLYFQLSGMLSETVELVGSGQGHNIETIPTVDPESLSPETREALYAAIQRAKCEDPNLGQSGGEGDDQDYYGDDYHLIDVEFEDRGDPYDIDLDLVTEGERKE